MPDPYSVIPEELKKQAISDAAGGRKKPNTQPKKEAPSSSPKPEGASPKPGDPSKKLGDPSKKDSEKPRRSLFRRRRAGILLSREEVKAIKKGRKELRKEMVSRGIKSKKEFEIVATSLGLYFDKPHGLLLLWLGAHWGALLGLALVGLLSVLFIYSTVTQMQGYFTINLSHGMFREGFTMSETIGFENPTSQLFAQPAVDCPCVSVKMIPQNVDSIDGEHNDFYFAYTFYLRNEGDNKVGYNWDLLLNAESNHLSTAAWVALFEDGDLRLYARESANGEKEALPAFGDNSRGYLRIPLRQLAPESDQFELIETAHGMDYYRVIPDKFLSADQVASGRVDDVYPMEVHKYTVVIWLEGDDPDCTNDLIGGSLGLEMRFRLISEESAGSGNSDGGWRSWWKTFWDNLIFWD